MALWDITDAILDIAYEIKNRGKKEKIYKCEVEIINDHHNVEVEKGILSEAGDFAYMPDRSTVIINPTVFIRNNKKVIYAPEGSFMGVDYKFLKNVAESQQYNALVQWKHLRKWVTVKVESKGSIDWTILNDTSGLSRSFSASSFLVLQTKALEFLKNTSDLKLIFAMLFALFFGFAGGFFTSSMINVIYRLIQ